MPTGERSGSPTRIATTEGVLLWAPMFSNTQDERRWYEGRATAVRLIRLLGRNDSCQCRNVFRALEVSCLTEESNDRRQASHSLVVQPQVLSR